MHPPSPRVRQLATQAQIDAAQAELDEWVAARTAILTRGQEVTVNGRRLQRADLAVIASEIQRLQRKVQRLSRTGQRQVVPK